jgi:ClpP class serine protease
MTTWLMPDEWVRKMEALEFAALSVTSEIANVELSTAIPMRIQRGIATIEIKGVLVKERSPMLDFFGIKQTAYVDIAEQTKAAVSKGAKKIRYDADSPGGDANGILIGMEAIQNAGIDTVVIADGYLTSGSYMLGSQADQIIASNELVLIGSIGVAASVWSSGRIKDITNSDSKKKRPDVSTEEGRRVVEEELDDMYQIIAERVASGRKTSVEAVKRDYGQGAVMTARTALQKKMIDGISTNNQPAELKAAKIGDKMDPKTLKQEHRATYDAIFEAGKEAGSKEENERACAHLILAEGSGDVEAAHKAIKDGDGITEMVKAQHMSAAMKRNMIAAREADNPPDINTNAQAPTVEDLDEKKMKTEFEAAHPGWEVE